MKVILAYVDDVDISPGAFKAGAQPEGPAHTFGGFPVSSTRGNAILSNASGSIRAYAGLFAAAFEHVFVSARPLAAPGPPAVGGLYHDLPLTLKLQRPDLFKTACETPAYSPFPELVGLEGNSEFLAMRLATTSANVAAGTVRTTINCIGNGVWEISPNNPPLVDTIAQFIAIPIYELEKAIVYDLLRRFRVYVTDQPIETSNQFVLMYASMNVPDFSDSGTTEKQLTAVVAVACHDEALLQGARQVLGNLPICLDEAHAIDQQSDIARLLHGFMKDSLAAACFLNS